METNLDGMSIHDLARQPEILLALEPEELAGVVLKDLVCQKEAEQKGQLIRHNYLLQFQQYDEDVQKAVVEAWMWLEREGCIAPKPGLIQGNGVFVTRRGKRLAESRDTPSYRRATFLPKEFLHPIIAQKTWSSFIRGEYDTAVFQAFKQVEVATREHAKLSPSDLGVALMRKAFHPDGGPLTDSQAEPGERQALSDLFAGAIGSYKNPHSHRNVALEDADEAVEMIVLASHLMKIIDARSQNQKEDK
jgi:uncharacterized protein (TIGR02391 family)